MRGREVTAKPTPGWLPDSSPVRPHGLPASPSGREAHAGDSSPPGGRTGDVDAKLLAIVSPGILGPDYFRECAAVVEAAAGGPPDLAALGAVMRRPL
jgi:hypothetical protein